MSSGSTTPLLPFSTANLGYQATIDSDSQPQAPNSIQPLATESNNSDTNSLSNTLSRLIEDSEELRKVRIADCKRARDINSEADKFSRQASRVSQVGLAILFLTAIFPIISNAKEPEKELEPLTKGIIGISLTIGIMVMFFSSHLESQASLTKRLATRITKDLG